MNQQTTTTTENTVPTVPQWAKGAGSEIYRKGLRDAEAIASIIADYARLRSTSAPSIWRPVSVKPTREDFGPDSYCIGYSHDAGFSIFTPMLTNFTHMTHWCRTADLLALAPLPAKDESDDAPDAALLRLALPYLEEHEDGCGRQTERLKNLIKRIEARATATTATGGRA